MNHAQSRPASFIPVKYRVPAPDPSRVSVATAGRSTLLGVPLPTFGREQTRVAAIRESRPTWPQPVATYHPPVHLNPPPVSTPSVRGKVRLVNGLAIAPSDAPPVVHRAVAAGNRLQKMPYKWGGGHAVLNDNGYDCSGTVSYVLREAGLMKGQMPSRGFFNYGESGEGEWITVWVRDGHVFMIIGGLRLDTGGSTTRTGPRWKTRSRSYKGLVPRHPRGL
ncbi:C40 family peptidase [Roseibacillus persicicus]|uniref:C40 family peptidase n=1 Tax=Roseibacillus persicicus TaxID=454148 RepID=UPI001678FFDF|nr:C40 family peptidase [Roseibacillus persicicus]